MDSGTQVRTVVDPRGKLPGWKKDPVTGLIGGKWTPEQWAAKLEAGKQRKQDLLNSRVQEVEVTQGPAGIRIKFVGQWTGEEKSELIRDLLPKPK